MNKNDLEKEYNLCIEKSVNSLLEKFESSSDDKSVSKILLKSWRNILFIEFRMLVLLNFMQKLENKPNLYKKLEGEIKDIKRFQKSLAKCEFFIFNLFMAIEKINTKFIIESK